jgi:hypothetical protein
MQRLLFEEQQYASNDSKGAHDYVVMGEGNADNGLNAHHDQINSQQHHSDIPHDFTSL